MLFVLGIFSFNVAMAENIHDDEKLKKGKKKEATSFEHASNCASAIALKEIRPSFIWEEVEDEPVYDAAVVNSMLKDKANDLITVKVFDEKGNLVDEEKISIHELMSTNFAANKLPVNSSFLMYHENTAYYIIH